MDRGLRVIVEGMKKSAGRDRAPGAAKRPAPEHLGVTAALLAAAAFAFAVEILLVWPGADRPGAPAGRIVANPVAVQLPEEVPPVVLPLLGGAPAMPLWRLNAPPAPAAAGRGAIAIVIDDMGINRRRAERAIALPGPLTFAFLPYAENAAGMAAAARAAGHEILAHLPMEPMDHGKHPGPHALLSSVDEAEVMRQLTWNLDRLSGFVGVNNHMGSRFTADPKRMEWVLRELKARGLLWLDSMTTGESVAWRVADRMGVPAAVRDVFLDNEISADGVHQQLAAVEALAARQGYAVAIGHPHDLTLDALARWLPAARDKGFVFVPVSTIAARRVGGD
jgi:uncharacterized protein